MSPAGAAGPAGTSGASGPSGPAGTSGASGAADRSGGSGPVGASGAGGRPVPVPDERSAPFWDAAAEHVLRLARCSRCRTISHPPDTVCPHCHSTEPEFEFVAVEGAGTVRSWTVMRQSFLPGFDEDVPFVLVDVELSAQPDLRLIGRLVDGPDADLRIGATVQLAFEDIRPGVSVPAFALEARR